jgi:hypothetical protein
MAEETKSQDKLVVAAAAYIKTKGVSGWSQRSNAEFFLGTLLKLQAQEAGQEVLISIMETASNASAFRQKLEKAGVIAAGARVSKAADALAEFEL